MSDTPAPVGNPSTPAGTSTPAPTASAAPATGSTGPAAPATTAPVAPKTALNAPRPAANVPKTTPVAPKTPENTLVQVVTSHQVPIKVLKPHPSLGAFAGDTTKVSAVLAAQLITSGHAEQTAEPVITALAKPTDAQLVQAKAAYQRYGAVTDFKNFQGNPMPEFEKLPEAIQCAWAAASNLAYSHKDE